jgi:hypothetical protein
MVTLNPSEWFGLGKLGAIARGTQGESGVSSTIFVSRGRAWSTAAAGSWRKDGALTETIALTAAPKLGRCEVAWDQIVSGCAGAIGAHSRDRLAAGSTDYRSPRAGCEYEGGSRGCRCIARSAEDGGRRTARARGGRGRRVYSGVRASAWRDCRNGGARSSQSGVIGADDASMLTAAHAAAQGGGGLAVGGRRAGGGASAAAGRRIDERPADRGSRGRRMIG